MPAQVAVVGSGLAGSEAALQLACFGISVDLFEMRPSQSTPAHRTGDAAELVCSNSFKSLDPNTSHGCVKKMLEGQSFLLNAAHKSSVPAGNSLAVDREQFSQTVSRWVRSHPRIHCIEREIEELPEGYAATLVATGPLTSPAFTKHLIKIMDQNALAFYDAIAPIVSKESLNMEVLFFADRYGKGSGDFLNIPLEKEQYLAFVRDLATADTVPLNEFEDIRYFESCLPIEVLAQRGEMTLAFGPMKPVGFTDPKTGKRPFAVAQLRQEDRFGQSYNLVGFQTKMTYPEQVRVLRKLPGLEQAEFVRLGSIHRNSYLNAPTQLRSTLQWKQHSNIFFAGQITGVEGYTEAIATGWYAARNMVRWLREETLYGGDDREMIGALLRQITDPTLYPQSTSFQPLNFHFGLLTPDGLPEPLQRDKKARRAYLSDRSVRVFQSSALWTMEQEERSPADTGVSANLTH